MAKQKSGSSDTYLVERVQTGVRIEKRILKVLKALAEYLKVLMAQQSSPEIYVYLGLSYADQNYGSMSEETIFKATVVDPGMAAPYYYLALAREKGAPREAVKLWQQFHKNLKTDLNRGFWLPVAEKKLRALGAVPAP